MCQHRVLYRFYCDNQEHKVTDPLKTKGNVTVKNYLATIRNEVNEVMCRFLQTKQNAYQEKYLPIACNLH